MLALDQGLARKSLDPGFVEVGQYSSPLAIHPSGKMVLSGGLKSTPIQVGLMTGQHVPILTPFYRYEREINRCERPAVRLIQERDASPNAAMVLCVFAISWPSGSPAEKVLPGLVLTDGWYKIRAQIDIALARAIKKRKIRVGSKLEIIGARVCGTLLYDMVLTAL